MTIGTPSAEQQIDDAIVRALLREQHPNLAESAIRLLDTGWGNEMYRLGDDLVVRLPRRSEAVELIEHEQAWLPGLAARLPIAIPAPLRIGRPSQLYPRPWSILLTTAVLMVELLRRRRRDFTD